MKSFALASLAVVASAAQLDGYTIDLCPDALSAVSSQVGDAIYLPGNEELRALSSIWQQVGQTEQQSLAAQFEQRRNLSNLI